MEALEELGFQSVKYDPSLAEVILPLVGMEPNNQVYEWYFILLSYYAKQVILGDELQLRELALRFYERLVKQNFN